MAATDITKARVRLLNSALTANTIIVINNITNAMAKAVVSFFSVKVVFFIHRFGVDAHFGRKREINIKLAFISAFKGMAHAKSGIISFPELKI